jgi:Uma2 family endonuclease
MATTTSTLVSVEEYLRRSEKPNAEYEDGVLHAKPVPTFSHSDLEYKATMLLRRQGALAFSELTLRLSPTKFLVPDVAVVRQVEGDYPSQPCNPLH